MFRTVVLAGSTSVLLAIAGLGDHGRTGDPAHVSLGPGAIIWIPASTFRMGSDGNDVYAAMLLCARDRLAGNRAVVDACMPFVHRDLTTQASLCGSPPSQPGDTFDVPGVFAAELGAHDVWVEGYGIDRTEVTVADYDRCVTVGVCPPASVSLGTPRFGGARQPIVDVAWDAADTYCRSVHGRLPTEAEWERAARGRDGRPFPWGRQWDPRRANHGSLDPSRAATLGAGCYDPDDGFAFTAPVGSYADGASADGVLDLAGNAAEWVSDLWDAPDMHGFAASDSRYPPVRATPYANPQGATHGAGHIVRGGGFDTPAIALRTTFRRGLGSGAHTFGVGFRCAYSMR